MYCSGSHESGVLAGFSHAFLSAGRVPGACIRVVLKISRGSTLLHQLVRHPGGGQGSWGIAILALLTWALLLCHIMASLDFLVRHIM